jgi:hypothetical protein
MVANRTGPRPGPFPGPPGAGLGREAAQNRRFPVLPPTHPEKAKNSFDCIGVVSGALAVARRCQRGGWAPRHREVRTGAAGGIHDFSDEALLRAPRMQLYFRLPWGMRTTNLVLAGLGPVSGGTWPRDPLQRVRLEIWCRTHTKLAPETKSKAVSWCRFSGPDTQVRIENASLSETQIRRAISDRSPYPGPAGLKS